MTTSCPHCTARPSNLTAHLRDDAATGGACPVLAARRTRPT